MCNGIKQKLTCSTMEVLIYQGATALLLIPSFAHSQARFFVSWLIAPKSRFTTQNCHKLSSKKHTLYHKKFQNLPLVAPWSVMDLSETKPDTDEVNTTLPVFDAFRNGCASWQMWKTDSKFVDIWVENSWAVNSTIGFRMFVPTLFTYWSDPQKLYCHINTKRILITSKKYIIKRNIWLLRLQSVFSVG